MSPTTVTGAATFGTFWSPCRISLVCTVAAAPEPSSARWRSPSQTAGAAERGKTTGAGTAPGSREALLRVHQGARKRGGGGRGENLLAEPDDLVLKEEIAVHDRGNLPVEVVHQCSVHGARVPAGRRSHLPPRPSAAQPRAQPLSPLVTLPPRLRGHAAPRVGFKKSQEILVICTHPVSWKKETVPGPDYQNICSRCFFLADSLCA
jgi:hypothetical protein